MTTRLTACVAVALGTLGAAGAVAGAQPATVEDLTLAPIECWTRPSTQAVRVGEIFTVVLTCAVVDTASTTVVPDQSRLDPGALQVPPFDVVGGTQAADLRTPTHRYFQYEYAVRFVGDQMGADVELPGPTIGYRVQSRVQGDTAIEGRDRQYVLPSARVRIVSLVPATATGIHDPLPVGFRDIADRRFRAGLLRILSWVLFGIGGVVAAWALAGALRRRQAPGAAPRPLATDAAILGAALRELDHVRRRRETEAWSSDLAARALAALRVVGAYALSDRVAQTPAAGASPGTGQLLVSSAFPRRRRTLVSSAVTAEAVAQAIARAARAGRPADDRLDDLQAALAGFTAAAYGRDDLARNEALDDAQTRGVRVARRLARDYGPPARTARALRRRLARMQETLWPR